MTKFILGVQSFANHDSGACIIKFGKKIKPELIAISEERLLRKKYPYSFPIHSILYCMRYFKIKNFSLKKKHNKINLSVDTKQDLKRILNKFNKNEFENFRMFR